MLVSVVSWLRLMPEKLVRIEAPWFVAGIVFQQGRVIRAAPIVNYMLGWDITRVSGYANRRRWNLSA